MTTVYGIRNCDTMKKAFAWLDQHKVAYAFHDYNRVGIDSVRLKAWSAQLGWETLLNRRGTTWRRLSPAQQAAVDEAKAIRLMIEYPTLIKRPVLEHRDALLVGFDARRYAVLLGG